MSEIRREIPSMLEDAIRLCEAREGYQEALALLADCRSRDRADERH